MRGLLATITLLLPLLGSQICWTECIQGDCWSKFGTKVVDNGKFEGKFLNGDFGHGVFTWTNGDQYLGSFKYGKMDGKGTFNWKNGDKYVGGFVYGRRTGKGTYTYANGNKREGVWENGNYFGTITEWDKEKKLEEKKKINVEKYLTRV